MFNNNSKPSHETNTKTEQAGGSINIIGAGTVIEGDVKSGGDIRIDGTVYGSIHSKARVVVGATGVVEGDVHSQNADVSGRVKGKTSVAELLFLKSTSKVTGDIITGKLVVEVGATFTGTCNMGPEIKDIKQPEKIAADVQQLAEKSAY
jgi:cytoskeletal protein CcmA (bactofilin family)